MDFTERLRKIRNDFETGETPRDIIDTLNQNVDRLIAENAISQALTVGQLAPLESPVLTEAGDVQLRDYLDDQFLVLTWFRGNW